MITKKRKIKYPKELFEPEFIDFDFSKTVYGECPHGNNMSTCIICFKKQEPTLDCLNKPK